LDSLDNLNITFNTIMKDNKTPNKNTSSCGLFDYSLATGGMPDSNPLLAEDIANSGPSGNYLLITSFEGQVISLVSETENGGAYEVEVEVSPNIPSGPIILKKIALTGYDLTTSLPITLTVKEGATIRRKGTCNSSNIRRKDDTLERATTNQTPQPFISNFSYTSGSPHLQQDSAYSGAFGDYVLVAKHVGQNAVIIRNESGIDHRLEVDMVGIAGGMVSWQRVYLNNYNGGDIHLSVHEGNGIKRRGTCSSGNVNRDK
jgi:hypothetical protein